MAKYSIEDTTLTNIANAIRSKTGNTNSIQVQGMADEIRSIQAGGSTENLDAVIAEQANLLAELQTALSGKSIEGGGGGGSVTTCTIEIINETIGTLMESYLKELWFVAYENGEIKGYGGREDSPHCNKIPANFDWKAEKITLNNVVCNSMMFILDDQTALILPASWYINNQCDFGYIIIPSTPNVTHTLKLDPGIWG